MDFDPVCGTDGSMYPNECELNKRACNNPYLMLTADRLSAADSAGKCSIPRATTPGPAPTTRTPAPTPSPTPTGTPAPTRPSSCALQCTNDWNPLCGSDAVTYDNACKFESGRCTNPNLFFVSTGGCPSKT